MSLGVTELLIILSIILLLFGANKLPQLAEALGKSVKNFRRSSQANDEIEVAPKARSIPTEAKDADSKSS